MKYTFDPRFLSPEYVSSSDTLKMYAQLLSTADAEIGANEVDASLFLMLVELHALVRSYSVARKRLDTFPDKTDPNVRRRVADDFRIRLKQSEGITKHVSDLIDYLADSLK